MKNMQDVIDVEQWADIKGYENYQISTYGRVKNKKSSVILKTPTDNLGYLVVNFSKNGKVTQHKVHRLVAEAFIPNPLGLSIINHKDLNKSNPHVDNLEWCTHRYNTRHAIENGHPPGNKSRRIRCIENNRVYDSISSASGELNISVETIIYHLKVNRSMRYKSRYSKFSFEYAD